MNPERDLILLIDIGNTFLKWGLYRPSVAGAAHENRVESGHALLEEIRQILRTQGQHNIALVGAGRLGSAIASSPIFAEHGITVAAVLDNDPDKIGQRVGDLMISSIGDIGDIARERNIIVGVIAVPADSAQNAADALIGAGAKIIFNYSEALLDVPADVNVHTSNPAGDLLYALYFHLA